MIEYYRHDGGYIAVTDESPAGFEGLVFVGRGGPLDGITDQLFASDVLTDPVGVGDVPAEWCAALGYHAVKDFPLLDEEGANLIAEIPVREQIDPSPLRPAQPVVVDVSLKGRFLSWLVGNDDRATQVGYVLGLILFVIVWRCV